MSLKDVYENYKKADYALFSMPGHKNRAAFVLPKEPINADYTELSVTDDLYASDGAISHLEDDAAALFESGCSCLSAGGASLCVMAAVGLMRNVSKKLLLSRFCHSSVINGMSIFGVEPRFISQRRGETGYDPVTPAYVEKALAADSEIKAVFLTSPDYYGGESDVTAIAAVCRERGAVLTVDNAHGTHGILTGGYPFDADIVCDSLHKTLPALTGSAVLNVSKRDVLLFPKEKAKSIMSRLSTTSPSYLLLYSAERALEWMKGEGREAYIKTAARVKTLKDDIKRLGFTVSETASDGRLVISALEKGLSGKELSDALLRDGVVCEMADENAAVLIVTPFNNERDFERLLSSLQEIGAKAPVAPVTGLIHIPERVLPLSFPEGNKTETVSVASAAGKIAAENVYIYPPSRPVVLTGERIDEETVSELFAAGKKNITVFAP